MKSDGGPRPRPVREIAKDIYDLVGKRKAKKLEKLLKELAVSLTFDLYDEA